ncbi:MAG: hypothetical protein K2X00_11230 [Nitrospiraceae bacterium]|nr:hypothetical protein [Nitrospiraceae bacterium]
MQRSQKLAPDDQESPEVEGKLIRPSSFIALIFQRLCAVQLAAIREVNRNPIGTGERKIASIPRASYA